MNFKLLTFIFVVIGVQSINSSIINKQSIDDLVQISNLDSEVVNVNAGDNPWAKIKSLTFNISDSVVQNGVKYSEVKCNNQGNDFCSRGNGKYQAKIVTCKNLAFGSGALFDCKLFNAKVLNKNVQYKGAYLIACLNGFNQENAKGKCRMEYSFASSTSYNEADDVENKLFSAISKPSIDNLVQTGNFNVEGINLNSRDNPWAKIKSFTFNISDTVVINKIRYPEVTCNNQGNDFCSRGNGKYQAKIVTCKNLDYGNEEKVNHFDCKLYGARKLNKNVKYSGLYGISCLSPFTPQTAKGRCVMGYSFSDSASYNEADDIDNEDEL